MRKMVKRNYMGRDIADWIIRKQTSVTVKHTDFYGLRGQSLKQQAISAYNQGGF